MRITSFCLINIVALIIVTVFAPVSAHFYGNVSAIPRSLIPSNSTWNYFNKYLGCHVGQNIEGLAKIKQYFQRFGYIDSSSKNFTDEFDDVLFSALKTYQFNFNLNTTGEFDLPTLQHMIKPRCGNPDIVNGTTNMNSSKSPANSGESPAEHTVAHFSFFEGRPRWQPSKNKLKYAFLPENQLTDSVKAVFRKAFDKWREVTPLTFTETDSYRWADIRIGFFAREHGDGYPFDGPTKILAHAFSPPVGFFHLDGEENWMVDDEFLKLLPCDQGGHGFKRWKPPLAEMQGPSPNPMHSESFSAPVMSRKSAVDLESVAVHEIGHLLGLNHSSEKEAIMFPTLDAGVRKVKLSRDDIEGIQMLYGSNPNNNNGSSTFYTPSQENDTSGASTFGSFCPHLFSLIIGFFLAFVLQILL